MKQTKPAPTPVSTPTTSGTFFTVVKSEHLLYLAFEIVVVDGVVVSSKSISRAPDLQASAVGICSREIWAAGRRQHAWEMK